MNTVQLIGNLSSDVTLKSVGDDKKVASFFIAVNRKGKDAGADFIPVSTWNGSADACAKYLKKGNKVSVEGQIRTRRFEDDNGVTQYRWEVSANSVGFLTPRSDDDAQPPTTEPSTAPPAEDDIPF